MQRSGQIGVAAGFACVIFPLLAALGMSLRFAPDIATRGLNNPDSYMRIVRLRDMLDSGRTLFAVARDGSGHGTILHWSHLLDSLLCLLSLPFRLFLGPADALYAAALVFGPLNLAAAAFAAAWAVAPFSDRTWLFLGGVLLAISPAIASYGVAGVVHHHVAAVLAAAMCWGWAGRLAIGAVPVSAGIALGAWVGIGIWFTPEALPPAAMGLAALGVLWIVSPGRDDIAPALTLAGLAFAATVGGAVLADPPEAGPGVAEVDRISVLFFGVALAATGIAAMLWAAHALVRTPRARAAAACAATAVGAGIWAWVFRNALLHSNIAGPDEDWHVFFDFISEMLPPKNAWEAVHFLFTGGLATALAGGLAVCRRSLALGFVAVCAVGLTVIGGVHVRFAAYPEAIGAMALPVALTLLHRVSPAWPTIGQSLARIGVILLFVQVPFAVRLGAPAETAENVAAAAVPPCSGPAAAALLAPYPGAVVLADVNETPELLYRTQARTVGSLYHRNIPGFLRLRAAWRSPPSVDVPAAAAETEASLVLACLTPARSSMLEGLAGPGLMDQLRSREPPPWLRRIGASPEAGPGAGHVLYRIAR